MTYALEVIYNSCIYMVQVLYSGMLLYISSQVLVQWYQLESLKQAMVGVFTPPKLANINNQGLSFQGKPVIKHLPAPQSENHLFNESCIRV